MEDFYQYKYMKFKSRYLKMKGLKKRMWGGEGVEITLTSRDEREFKVDAQVAIMSETVKSMLGIDDPSEEIDPPEAAIPLPAVEGNILELVLKYCTYHHENKETKEEEKNAWDAEFVKVDDDTLISLLEAANYLDIKTLLELAR